MNIIDGGLCPSSKVPHIEFLLFPDPDVQLLDAVETSIRVRDYAREVCYRRGYEAATSQQGAISVPLQSCTEGMDIILAVLQELGVESGFRLGLDMAASDVWRNGKYQFPWTNRALSADALLDTYLEWIPRYSLRYLEDGFSASAMSEFTVLTSKAGDMMIAGDDLFASNVSRVTAGVQGGWANAVVVKPNQAGTVSAAIRAAEATRNNGATLVISQRSGENGGSFISSLAIACGARYIKVGGPARMDRIAKINELLTTLAPK
nr:hypothetical protein [Nocardia terpenica]